MTIWLLLLEYNIELITKQVNHEIKFFQVFDFNNIVNVSLSL